MLRCRDTTLLASDYVDGRLRWRKRLSLLAHLLMCPHCRRFMGQFKTVIRVIRGFEPTPPDSATLNRFARAIDETIEHDYRKP